MESFGSVDVAYYVPVSKFWNFSPSHNFQTFSLLHLSLFDLSAAFDTIDHSILLSHLRYSFGISDTVLAWFTAYLTDCTQTVSVNGSKSLQAPLHYGVPQRSVLGAIVFVLYTQPLSKIIQHHSLYHYSFLPT